MPTINQLSAIDVVSPGDQIPVYAPNLGDARRMSVSALTQYVEDNIVLPDPTNAADITYDPAGTGAVSRSVQAKLRDVVSVKDFGAVGDGVADDTAAIQAAVAYAAAGSGSAIYIPEGTFKVSGNLIGNYEWPRGSGGLHIYGAGSNSTILVWAGSSSGTMFRGFGDGSQTNAGWTYGFSLKGMTLYGNASPFVIENVSQNTVGIFIEKAQNLWSVDDIMMAGWGTCIQIGVHAERGSFSNLWLGYSYVGVDGFGQYSDLTVFKDVYTYAIIYESIKLSSPRMVFEDWVIVKAVGWSNASYPDIRIGYKAIRSEDIGKSSSLTAGTGSAGNGSVFRNMRFERSDASFRDVSFILFENINARTSDNGEILMDTLAFPNQLNVAAISIRDKRENLRIRGAVTNYLTPALIIDEYTSLASDANNSSTANSDTLRWIWLSECDASNYFSGRRNQISFGSARGKTSINSRNNASSLTLTAQGSSTITKDASTGIIIIEKPNSASENCMVFTMPASASKLRVYFSADIESENWIHLSFYNGTTYLLRIRNVPREALNAGLSFVYDNSGTDFTINCLVGVRSSRECVIRFDEFSYAY